jgi:hypothetical protein
MSDATRGQMCRHISVVKNELRLNTLKTKYDKTKEDIEDLTDAWRQSLRRKKKVKRKLVKVNARGDGSAQKRWGPGVSHVDELEYKIWLLGDLQDKLLEEQARAKVEVCHVGCLTFEECCSEG